jgi:hypothetical protein
MAQKFQKLNIDLPRQPLSDQKIWMVAGWLLAAIVTILIVISYINFVNGENIESVSTAFLELNECCS